MATKQIKFSDLNRTDKFYIDGEIFMKTGPMTYVSIENPILGEYTIQPYTESRIKPYTPPVAVKAKVVPAPVKKALAPKKAVKKTTVTTKKPVKKK